MKGKIFSKMAYFCRFRWLPFEGINFLQDRPPRFARKTPFYMESKIFLSENATFSKNVSLDKCGRKFWSKPCTFPFFCPWISEGRL